MNEKTGTGVSSEKEKVKESQFKTVSRTHQPPRRGWGRDRPTLVVQRKKKKQKNKKNKKNKNKNKKKKKLFV